MKLKHLMILTLGIVILSIITVNAETNTPFTMHNHENHQLLKIERNEFINVEKNDAELSHTQIVQVTKRFMDQLVQEVDDDYKVIKYNTMEQLKNSFSNIATKNVVDQFVDFYFVEKEDGLYIIPTDTPPWFESNADYEMKKIGDQSFLITQQNKSDLHGNYTIMFEIKLNEKDEPIIINVQYK
ncbi:hypothetical protein ACLIA0_13225 [Bacillaceae bacterium W0354]